MGYAETAFIYMEVRVDDSSKTTSWLHFENSPRGPGAFGDTDKLRGKGIEVCAQACTKVGGIWGSCQEIFGF